MTNEMSYIEDRCKIPIFDSTRHSNQWVLMYKVEGKWVYEYCKDLKLARSRYDFVCNTLREEYRELHPNRKTMLNIKPRGNEK